MILVGAERVNFKTAVQWVIEIKTTLTNMVINAVSLYELLDNYSDEKLIELRNHLNSYGKSLR